MFPSSGQFFHLLRWGCRGGMNERMRQVSQGKKLLRRTEGSVLNPVFLFFEGLEGCFPLIRWMRVCWAPYVFIFPPKDSSWQKKGGTVFRSARSGAGKKWADYSILGLPSLNSGGGSLLQSIFDRGGEDRMEYESQSSDCIR
jgi:hypothetical protein